MLGTTSLFVNAFSKFSMLQCSGSSVPYQFSENAVRISAICGSAASSVIRRKKPDGRSPRMPASGADDVPAVPLTIVPVDERSSHFASRYISEERISMTVTRA